MRELTEITGFHAHVYFDTTTRETADRVREGLSLRFTVEMGRWHEQPVGPHTTAMYQVASRPELVSRALLTSAASAAAIAVSWSRLTFTRSSPC